MSEIDELLNGVIEGVGVEPEGSETPLDADYNREGFAWAQDVYFVYETLGNSWTKARAGTAARFALGQYARRNMDQFMGQLLPKAMTLLEKAREKSDYEDIVMKEERKSIEELRQILRNAIEEEKALEEARKRRRNV